MRYHEQPVVHKQALLAAAAGLMASPFVPERAWALPASKAQAADVGTYLPPAGVDDFVEFIVSKDKTPVRTLTKGIRTMRERGQNLFMRGGRNHIEFLTSLPPVCSGHQSRHY